MAASLDRTADPAPAAARARALIDLSAICLLVALPILMVFANRSSPAVMGVAAALALVAALIHPGPQALGAALARMARTPEALAGFAFLGLALLSILWSVDRRLSIAAYGELLAPLAAGALLAAALPERLPRWAAPALGGALAAATALVVIELQLDFPFRRLWSARLEDYVMNRPVVTATLLVWPLAAALRGRGRTGLAAAALAVAALGALASTSGSAKLSLIVGAFAYAAALAAPRIVRALIAPGLLLAMAMQPVFGLALSKAIPETGFAALSSAHARERVNIWVTFGEVATLRLTTGTGFGSSPRLHMDPVAAEVPERHREMLAVGHPHNAFLQVWTELGLPGALLALVLLGMTGLRLSRLPDALFPERIACAAAIVAVAMESHGAWQGWWIAAVALSLLLFGRLRPGDAAPRAEAVQA